MEQTAQATIASKLRSTHCMDYEEVVEVFCEKQVQAHPRRLRSCNPSLSSTRRLSSCNPSLSSVHLLSSSYGSLDATGSSSSSEDSDDEDETGILASNVGSTRLILPHTNCAVDAFTMADFEAVEELVHQLVYSPLHGHAFIGVDEYPTRASLQMLLSCGTTLVITDCSNLSVVGFLCITSTKFTRTFQKTNADLVLGLSTEALMRYSNIFEDVMTYAVEVTKNLNYSGVTFESFSMNHKLFEKMAKFGYNVVAEIPSSATVVGHGLISSKILFKKLSETVNAPAGAPAGALAEYRQREPYNKTGMAQHLPYLPLTLTTKSGFSFCLDYMKSGDMKVIGKFIRDAAILGRGYTQDDIDDLDESDAFLEDQNSTYLGLYDVSLSPPSKPFGAMVFCPNFWTRSMNPCIADVWIIVSPQYEGRGVGSVLSSLWRALPGDLGYKGLLVDAFANNHGMLKIMQKLNYLHVGFMPNCGDVIGAGWTDACLFYSPTTSAAAEHFIVEKEA